MTWSAAGEPFDNTIGLNDFPHAILTHATRNITDYSFNILQLNISRSRWSRKMNLPMV